MDGQPTGGQLQLNGDVKLTADPLCSSVESSAPAQTKRNLSSDSKQRTFSISCHISVFSAGTGLMGRETTEKVDLLM